MNAGSKPTSGEGLGYGIVYQPTSPKNASTISVNGFQLESLGIKYVRVQWVDLTNTVRFRVLPLSYFKKLYTSSRPAVGLAYSTLGMVGPMAAQGFSGMGEHLYVPDLSSFRVCSYASGHGVVMGWFQEKTPSPSGSLASPLCPRMLLQRIIEYAHPQIDQRLPDGRLINLVKRRRRLELRFWLVLSRNLSFLVPLRRTQSL